MFSPATAPKRSAPAENLIDHTTAVPEVTKSYEDYNPVVWHGFCILAGWHSVSSHSANLNVFTTGTSRFKTGVIRACRPQMLFCLYSYKVYNLM